MKNEYQFLYKGIKLHYQIKEGGEKKLWIFPGFGQEISNLERLSDELSKSYTVFTFNLFYHGHSYWSHHEVPLTKAFWRDLIRTFIQERKITKYSILGISIGARLSLATLEASPENIDQIILAAPDGIYKNWWYSLATGTSIPRRYFKSIIVKPHRILSPINTAQRLGLLDRRLGGLATSQLKSLRRRKRVYYTWNNLRLLHFQTDQLISLINRYHMRMQFILAESDQLIDNQRIKRFASQLKRCEVKTIPGSHQRVIGSLGDYF